MPVFKCKMCGGALEVADGMTVCECEYCGTQQTLPKTDNEQILNMFNRANHFRQQCEFDKAADLYEKIAAQGDTDAELYWSLVLCRYGIEYVDDPKTKKKIATCHRTQFKSILDDPDYKAALDHADFIQRGIYEREAAYIDKIQKRILEISNKEQPFDVFICYKEADERGRRTPDSVLAQELYYGLMQEGFKVFFSRITLESKLGAEYEPYIFAALNSAKVMVVVGTKAEHFNAVWVRNEWSRYLMIMQKDHNRTLIPAFKDMDPYDLPDELSMFQAQDMSKLGFMQDLIRGISKLIKKEVAQPTDQSSDIQQMSSASNYQSLLKRAELFLEDGDWSSVKKYCNRVLDREPECATAYLYLLMAEKNITSEEKLLDIGYSLADNRNYKLAVRFADDKLRERLEGYVTGFEKKKNKAIENVNLYLRQQREGTPKERLAKAEKELSALKLRLTKISETITNQEQIIENTNTVNLRYKNTSIVSELNRLQGECNTIEKEINSLKTRVSHLGIFSGKAKELLNSQIQTLESKKRDYLELIQLKQYNLSQNNQLISQHNAANELITKLQSEKQEIESQEIPALQKKIDKLQQENADFHIVTEHEYLNVKRFLENLPDNIRPYIPQNNANNSSSPAKQTGTGDFQYERTAKCDTYIFGGIEWYVLSRTQESMTIITKNVVCEMEYHNEKTDITWEYCTLRAWLNGTFYNQFSKSEKSQICLKECTSGNNNKTADRVYILSPYEYSLYKAKIPACERYWWLRSPKVYSTFVSVVTDSKEVANFYMRNKTGVRPVVTIKLMK